MGLAQFETYIYGYNFHRHNGKLHGPDRHANESGMIDYLIALFIGFVEGLTEFLPVSSTAHIVLLVEGLNLPTPPGHVFEVFIQLGAIMAVMWIYRAKLWHTVTGLPSDPVAQKFTINMIVATIPAVLAGLAGRDWIKENLYNPVSIAIALIIGGVIILLLEKKLRQARIHSVDDIPWRTALLIGCCQALALMPGVSRSGATIMGALGAGLARPVAAEFSFFLAIPVMLAAVAYDTYKGWDAIMANDHLGLMLAGLAAAFVTALCVVKAAIYFISRFGFTPFAWYRIVLGFVVLAIFL
jgi:undecaprenyl-diphosphatase